jgi:hypothetical protein
MLCCAQRTQPALSPDLLLPFPELRSRSGHLDVRRADQVPDAEASSPVSKAAAAQAPFTYVGSFLLRPALSAGAAEVAAVRAAMATPAASLQLRERTQGGPILRSTGLELWAKPAPPPPKLPTPVAAPATADLSLNGIGGKRKRSSEAPGEPAAAPAGAADAAAPPAKRAKKPAAAAAAAAIAAHAAAKAKKAKKPTAAAAAAADDWAPPTAARKRAGKAKVSAAGKAEAAAERLAAEGLAAAEAAQAAEGWERLANTLATPQQAGVREAMALAAAGLGQLVVMLRAEAAADISGSAAGGANGMSAAEAPSPLGRKARAALRASGGERSRAGSRTCLESAAARPRSSLSSRGTGPAPVMHP